MKYTAVKEIKRQIKDLTVLSGGTDGQSDPLSIKDSRFKKAENLWYKNGKICTRPSIYGQTAGAVLCQNINLPLTVTDTEIEYEGKIYNVCYYSFYETSVEYIVLSGINKDGEQISLGRCPYYHTGIEECLAQRLTFIVGKTVTPDGTGIFLMIKRPVPEGSGNGIYELKNDYSTWLIVTDNIYIPKLMINGRGAQYDLYREEIMTDMGTVTWPEKMNMLTSAFFSYFTTEGHSWEFYLPMQNLDNTTVRCRIYETEQQYTDVFIPFFRSGTFELGGVTYTADCDRSEGRIYFTRDGLPAPLPTVASYGRNNLEILAYKLSEVNSDSIIGNKLSYIYNSRAYVFGADGIKNGVYSSVLTNPLYFPKNGKTTVGGTGTGVTAAGYQNNKLIVFKPNETYKINVTNGTVLSQVLNSIGTVEDFELADKLESESISMNIGCMGKRLLATVGGRLVWLGSDRQIYSLEATTYGSEKNLYCISTPISDILKEIPKEKFLEEGSFACACGGLFLLFVGGKVIVADLKIKEYGYPEKYANFESRENIAWYVWKMPENLRILSGENIDGEMIFTCSYTDENDQTVMFYAKRGTETDRLIVYENEEFSGVEFYKEYKLETKTFDFDMADENKKIDEISLTLKNADNAILQIITDSTVHYKNIIWSEDMKTVNEKLRFKPTRTLKLRLTGTGDSELLKAKIKYRLVKL